MDEFKKEVIITALKKMFKSSYFDICTIDKCLRISNIIPSANNYDCLSALHCIHWKDMSSGLRQEVFDKVIEMFQGRQIDFSILDMMFDENTSSFIPKTVEKKKTSSLRRLK